MQEIESFRAMQPDSPYQIPADFHRARALYELGKKDEARTIWQDIVTKYPKNELVPECQQWLNRRVNAWGSSVGDSLCLKPCIPSASSSPPPLSPWYCHPFTRPPTPHKSSIN